MRIAYLNSSGRMGGAETSLRELLASVRVAEPAWELWLVLGEDGPLAGIARDMGVRVIVAPFPPSLARLGDAGRHPLAALWSLVKAARETRGYTRRLRGILAEIEPAIIHTNGLKMHLLGCWTKPAKAKLAWHIHDYVGMRALMKWLLRLHQAKCAAAIANSKSVAADTRTVLPGLFVETIYNAIDLEKFSPMGPRIDLDQVSGLPAAQPGTLRVGLVSTFARWKGQGVFLKALALLPEEIRGYIIGGPIYQTDGSQWSVEELRDEAGRLGLADRVGFTGFVTDTAGAMRSLDVIVHASTQPEPFGMVIIEGMACGKAVVASAGGGATELFADGENALGHPPGDAASLAERIATLSRDAELRNRLGKSARRAVEDAFDRKRLARELLFFYKRMCGGLGEAVGTAISSSPGESPLGGQVRETCTRP